jgi:hypothetical protein
MNQGLNADGSGLLLSASNLACVTSEVRSMPIYFVAICEMITVICIVAEPVGSGTSLSKISAQTLAPAPINFPIYRYFRKTFLSSQFYF